MLPPMLLLILTLIPLDPSSRVVVVRDFATLTTSDAFKLDGRQVVLRLERDSLTDERDGFLVFDCAGPNDLHRTCWLRSSEKVGTRLTVTGTLRVIRHPPSRDGLFPAFIEIRLVNVCVDERHRVGPLRKWTHRMGLTTPMKPIEITVPLLFVVVEYR